MKPFVWKEGMSAEECKEGVYWERNMLALYFGMHINSTWKAYNELMKESGGPVDDRPVPCGWYYDTDNMWDGWLRVISLSDGMITFHVPDDFDMGNLPQIQPNWDGSDTKEKWIKLMRKSGCKLEE